MDETVAHLSLVAVFPTGEERAIGVVVGKPRLGERCWMCPISLPGISECVRDVCGVNSLQALTLALYLIAVELTIVVDNGGRLLDPETRDPFPLEAYFPPLTYVESRTA